MKIYNELQIKNQNNHSKVFKLSFQANKVDRILSSASKVPANIWTMRGFQSNPEAKKFLGIFSSLKLEEKAYFIKKYCEETGLPNLKEVTNKINKEILRAVNKISSKSDVKPLFVGYSSISSLGRELALPGSDADGLYILMDKQQNEICNISTIGLDMNQRLVDTTGEHFPEGMCIDNVMQGLDMAEYFIKENKLLSNESDYKEKLKYSGDSYIEAGKLNLDIAKHIEDREYKFLINRTGFFVELLRSGKILLNDIDKKDLDRIKKTFFYKYSNMYRQEGLKDSIKPKLQNRMQLEEDYKSMQLEDKFEFCKDLWERSLGAESSKHKKYFLNFDFNDILEMYHRLGQL